MIQGESSLLAFAEKLRQDADNSEAFHGYKVTAADLREAADIITRLSPLDHDIEVITGEN